MFDIQINDWQTLVNQKFTEVSHDQTIPYNHTL